MGSLFIELFKMGFSVWKGFFAKFFWAAIIISVLSVIGWVANIFQIISSLSDPVTVLLVLKIVGIAAAPLGVILGWVGIF